MSHKRVLGAVLGLAAGLLMASCLVVGAYILAVFLFPILLAPLAVGIILGLRLARVGALPRLPWAGIVAAGLVVLPVAVLLPYKIAVTELHVLGRAIPVPPEAHSVATRTNPFGSASAGPSVARLFETVRAPGDVISFYRQALIQSGWREFDAGEQRAWFTRRGSHLLVEAEPNERQTVVSAQRHVDGVWSPWLVLLGTGAVSGFVLWRFRRASS